MAGSAACVVMAGKQKDESRHAEAKSDVDAVPSRILIWWARFLHSREEHFGGRASFTQEKNIPRNLPLNLARFGIALFTCPTKSHIAPFVGANPIVPSSSYLSPVSANCFATWLPSSWLGELESESGHSAAHERKGLAATTDSWAVQIRQSTRGVRLGLVKLGARNSGSMIVLSEFSSLDIQIWSVALWTATLDSGWALAQKRLACPR